jgi:hypothetical protein
MNIFEFCDKFSISLAKARKMEKAHVLRLDENTPGEALEIRHLLLRGQPLSTLHLVSIIENPGWKMELGKYADKADALIAALGDVKAGQAPLRVTMYIADAAKGDEEALGIIKEWICETIPSKGFVPHNWLASRLLLGIPPIDRPNDVPRLPRVFLNVRKREDFRGWWKVSGNGTRNQTFYGRPGRFDL